MTPREVVLAFWHAMESNDFYRAAQWLAEDFECFWPQSSEIIIGRNNFAQLNSAYPTEGIWRFTVQSVIAEGNQVVTDVSVSDGERNDRAITFHTVKNDRITTQTEYWPEDYPAPAWRSQWVEIVEPSRAG